MKPARSLPELALLAALALALGCGTAPGPRIHVAPSQARLTYDFAYAPGWSVQDTAEGPVLTSPEPSLTVHMTIAAANGMRADDCAARAYAARTRREPVFRQQLMNLNWDAVVLEGVSVPPRGESTSDLVVCYTTRTSLEYPAVVLSVTAPTRALGPHRQALQDLIWSVRFKPAA